MPLRTGISADHGAAEGFVAAAGGGSNGKRETLRDAHLQYKQEMLLRFVPNAPASVRVNGHNRVAPQTHATAALVRQLDIREAHSK